MLPFTIWSRSTVNRRQLGLCDTFSWRKAIGMYVGDATRCGAYLKYTWRSRAIDSVIINIRKRNLDVRLAKLSLWLNNNSILKYKKYLVNYIKSTIRCNHCLMALDFISQNSVKKSYKRSMTSNEEKSTLFK